MSAGYGRTRILADVGFEVKAGEALGLIGTSGAGKSTLVLGLLGLLPWRGGFASGEVLFEGQNLLTMPERQARQLRGRRFALVPQSPMNALNGALSLWTHFREAWRAHRDAYRDAGSSTLEARVRELIEQMQLPPGPDFLARRPGAISVGQAQRVLIALALLHRPSLLIADEPTSALDPATQAGVIRLLRSLNSKAGSPGTALLYISHDLTSVLQLCDRVAVLDSGSIVECLPADTIGLDARHPATLSLLDALPVPSSMLRAYAKRRASLLRDPGDGRDAVNTGTFSSPPDIAAVLAGPAASLARIPEESPFSPPSSIPRL
jgi:ABC-type glutathione transport system ATPase component